jgi:hypothetical protein
MTKKTYSAPCTVEHGSATAITLGFSFRHSEGSGLMI